MVEAAEVPLTAPSLSGMFLGPPRVIPVLQVRSIISSPSAQQFRAPHHYNLPLTILLAFWAGKTIICIQAIHAGLSKAVAFWGTSGLRSQAPVHLAELEGALPLRCYVAPGCDNPLQARAPQIVQLGAGNIMPKLDPLPSEFLVS